MPRWIPWLLGGLMAWGSGTAAPIARVMFDYVIRGIEPPPPAPPEPPPASE